MSTSRKEVVEAMLRYLSEADPSCAIDTNSDLNGAGLLDSLAALQIHLFIEEKFKIRIPKAEMNLKNLYSVNTIADLVIRYQSGLQA